jgi:hypothetical protein
VRTRLSGWVAWLAGDRHDHNRELSGLTSHNADHVRSGPIRDRKAAGIYARLEGRQSYTSNHSNINQGNAASSV